MSLPRYPTYKASRIEWLGQVPTHWEVVPLRSVARLESGHTPSRQHPEYWEDCTVPWFSLADVCQIREQGRSVIYETAERISELGIANSAARRLPPGTVMLSRTASVGFAAIMGVEMATTEDFANWVCGPRLVPQFLLHVFRAMRGEFTRLMYGSTHNTIYMPDLQAFRIALPSEDEQLVIVTFLDHEAAKIDGLVAEQKHLIELLKEKRQAVITQAVTMGLNPDATLKDSGIEWVGDIPAHWAAVRNRSVFREIDERSESDSGELLSVSHITGVTRRSEKDVNMFLAETLEGYKTCAPGDLVINTMWAWMGALGCSPHDGLVSPSYNVYRPRDAGALLPAYYDYLSRLPAHAVAMKSRSSGVWESRLRLYPDAFLDMLMPLPPPEEQEAIVAYLREHLRKWDERVLEAERAIGLLKERRSALIAAAVTGQIDVRTAAEMSAA